MDFLYLGLFALFVLLAAALIGTCAALEGCP